MTAGVVRVQILFFFLDGSRERLPGWGLCRAHRDEPLQTGVGYRHRSGPDGFLMGICVKRYGSEGDWQKGLCRFGSTQ